MDKQQGGREANQSSFGDAESWATLTIWAQHREKEEEEQRHK